MEAATTSAKRLSYAALDALREAMALAWWYKRDLERFVRTCVPHPEVLARIDFGLSKRDVVADLIDALGTEPKYTPTLLDLMDELCSLDGAFPHLARLEDGAMKVAAAKGAIHVLQQQYAALAELVADERNAMAARAEARKLAESRRASRQQLEGLRVRFHEMLAMEAQARGFGLQPLLRDLFDAFDLDPKASFAIVGEQVDGAFSFDGDDYLLEARWQHDPTDPAALRDFAGKIDTKLKTTLGVFVSINGFTVAAATNHSRTGANMFLVDGEDLYAILDDRARLPDVLLRKRRHASQTGNIYLRVRDF
jgi:hypothetical protein